MLVDPEEARDRRLEDDERPALPVRAALRHSTCPLCHGIIEPGDAIACLERHTAYAHVGCCEFELDLRADPHATRLREQREWRKRTEGHAPQPVRVPPARKRKRRRAAA